MNKRKWWDRENFEIGFMKEKFMQAGFSNKHIMFILIC